MSNTVQTTASHAAAEFLAAGFKPVITLPGLVPCQLRVESQCTTCEGPRRISLNAVRNGVVCAHQVASPQYAEKTAREAGFAPCGPYPGRASRPWQMACTDCGTKYNLSLSRMKSGWRCPCLAQKETAVKEMRAAGYEPETDYPGKTHIGWP